MLLIILLVLPQRMKKKDTDAGPDSLPCAGTSSFSNKMMTSHVLCPGLRSLSLQSTSLAVSRKQRRNKV